MLKPSLVLGCLISSFFFCQAQEITPEKMVPDLPSAMEILNATALIYSTCNTYQDTGSVITRFEKSTPNFETKINFATAFIRPDKFHFEFWGASIAGPETRYVVWMSGTDIKTWWSIQPKVEVHSQISNAVAGATGVSSSSAYTIPSLLIKEAAWKGKGWTNPHQAYRISDGILGVESCYRVQRLTSSKPNEKYDFPGSKGTETYWIRKVDSLLVRVDSDSDFGKSIARSTTLYSPKIDEPVSEAMLDFKH